MKTWGIPVGGTCADVVCTSADATYIADSSAWDGFHFGECSGIEGPGALTTTDGTAHSSQAECQAACQCH